MVIRHTDYSSIVIDSITLSCDSCQQAVRQFINKRHKDAPSPVQIISRANHSLILTLPVDRVLVVSHVRVITASFNHKTKIALLENSNLFQLAIKLQRSENFSNQYLTEITCMQKAFETCSAYPKDQKRSLHQLVSTTHTENPNNF